MRRARMPTICRTTTGPLGRIEPDLGPFVQLPGFFLIGGQELPGMILHPGDTARNRGPVDVNVHRRQENCDLLPRGRVEAPGGRARHHHFAVGRGDHLTRPERRAAVGIAKEEEKKSRKHQRNDAKDASGRGGHGGRDSESNSNERPTGRVDAHQSRSASILREPGRRLKMLSNDGRGPIPGLSAPCGP